MLRLAQLGMYVRETFAERPKRRVVYPAEAYVNDVLRGVIISLASDDLASKVSVLVISVCKTV